MATPMTAVQFLNLIREWGIPYKEIAGWPTRNRNPAGAWGPVHGILLHHTGDDAPDDADEHVLTFGRSDLPGPLCQWGMRDDGRITLIGWGRANHAGKGAANVLAALQDDRPVPSPGPDAIDGNARLYGQETMYSGKRRMTAAAYASTVAVFAAICTFHGWSAESCIGHREWTRRKPDPGSLDMDEFRADVARAIKVGPPRPAGPTPSTPTTQGKGDDEQTGDNVPDHEVFSYLGKTYHRRGWFFRYIDDPDELHALIDPTPKGLGLPVVAANVAYFRGLVDLDKLEAKLTDASETAALAYSAVKELAAPGGSV